MHSLEHGHTILWYDDTVKEGTDAYKDVQAISKKFGEGDYFIAAPWTKADGKAFPSGKHVALTHWTAGEAEGRHAVLRRPERCRRGAVHGRVPGEQRARARRTLI